MRTRRGRGRGGRAAARDRGARPAGREGRTTSRSRCAKERSSASPRSRVRARTSCSPCSPASAGLEGGEILFAGTPFSGRHPYDAIRRGVALVPADRLLALLPQRPIHENLAAPRYNRVARWGPINLREERRAVRKAIDDLQIDTRAAPAGAPALRRQPAEGDDRPLARLGLPHAALLRPDARDRRRHEAADLRAAARARRRGRRGPLLLERAHRVPARLRPRDHALRGPRDGRAGRRPRPTRRRCCRRCTDSAPRRRRREHAWRPCAKAERSRGGGSRRVTAGRSACCCSSP